VVVGGLLDHRDLGTAADVVCGSGLGVVFITHNPA
jgi:hypothetical protein